MTVNGEVQKLKVEQTETLRDVLRLKLGLLSIKDMCLGWGACGSCTVIMDGRPVLSCMTLACQCDGAVIETSEGIARDNHPLIDKYVDYYCMQCGYCTPGFVTTAKALLDHNANPTEADIREALAGNLCRCATYTQHIPAIQEAASALKGGS
jgi:aerobic-type carbon monoxide dehydrogenase small subunit (CoxS/CutS family)